MKPTISSGKQLAEHANLSNSSFHDVNLSEADFNDVNLSKAHFTNINLSDSKFHDINFSDMELTAAQIGGALFKHIGPPPDSTGKQQRQRPVTFEEAMLCDSVFRKVDLSNVKITDCNTNGMTIDGILVSDMLDAYRKQNKA